MNKKTTKGVRLSKDVNPIRYKISLKPDLEIFTFEGEEEITLEIKKSSNKITLHSAELEILEARIISSKKILQGKVTYDLEAETATILFPFAISIGTPVLKLKFTGILNDKMRGFYRSRYELDGKTYHMATTQFESTDARRAFPSFDEPSKKAIFDVSLIVPKNRTVISNTIEIDAREHSAGLKIIDFAPTPKMSSYLLAFIVGHFEHIEKKTENGVRVRIYVTPGKKKQAEFALDVAVKSIAYFEKYFAIAYPLPTLDLIAIPDFSAGAMENWGAITYRENALLVDAQNTSTQLKQYVAVVIAHEIAHQWFGNLVTMEWWTHLWLNEGFASFMEYKAVDDMFPEWKIWKQFVNTDHATALELDGLVSTHPIEVEVGHPSEIAQIFDAVSYSKGASIIRMLAEYLGKRDFRDGLRSYLKKYSYSNATTDDLWDALGEVSGKPVKKIMQSWTKTPGYPLITVDSNKNSVNFSQERFFSSAKSKRDNSTWLVPVSLKTSYDNKTNFYYLDRKKLSIPLTYKFDWIKANAHETSFLRVKYSDKLLASLKSPIENRDKRLFEEDRLGIIRDLFTLSEAGLESTDKVLDFVKAFENEESYIVWAQIINGIKRTGNLIFEEDFYQDYQAFVRSLLEKIVKKVGWNKEADEPYSRAFLRSGVIYTIGYAGDKQIIATAKKMFASSTSKKIDPDLRSAIYALVAENGDEKDYVDFRSMYKKAKLPEEKDRITRALSSFKQPELLQKTLDFTFSDEVRAQDAFKAVYVIMSNPYGRILAWNYVSSHWAEIVAKYKGGHLLPRFMTGASNFTTEKMADEVEKFFIAHPTEGIERSVAQTIEQIRSNADWLSRDRSKIKKFFASGQ